MHREFVQVGQNCGDPIRRVRTADIADKRVPVAIGIGPKERDPRQHKEKRDKLYRPPRPSRFHPDADQQATGNGRRHKTIDQLSVIYALRIAKASARSIAPS